MTMHATTLAGGQADISEEEFGELQTQLRAYDPENFFRFNNNITPA